jgi:indolepyruvate ferredoxin oxidoreductase beta subunit
MNRNIILCGVGGQGTVLASRLISAAAMKEGIPVQSAETIGMAQRGGSVFSHIRLGEGVNTPMIGLGQADLILGFELGETVRQLPYLKEGGKVIAADKAVMPVTASLSGGYEPDVMRAYLQQRVADLKIVEVEEAFQALHSTKVLNLLLLGSALHTDSLGLSEQSLLSAIRENVPPRFLELNLKAINFFK